MVQKSQKFSVVITNMSGERVSTATFKNRKNARIFKNKILDAKISAIKRKGKSALTGFNPRIRRLKI